MIENNRDNSSSLSDSNSTGESINSRLDRIERDIDSLRKLIIDQSTKSKKLVYLMIINLYLVVLILIYFLIIAR